MSRTRIALLVCGFAIAGVIAADFYYYRRSRPIDRPPGIKPATSAAEYSYVDAAPLRWQEAYWPAVEEYLKPLPPHSSVIDLGCGNGSFLARLRGRGWKLTGVDLSKSGIQLARAQWPDIRFEIADVAGDLSSLGYGTFDAVISTEVIEHIYLPRKFTANCLKLLRPGRMLVISTPYNGYAKNLGVALMGSSDGYWNPLWDHGHIKFWSVETLSRLLYESGFDQLEWRGAGGLPHFWTNMVFRARVPPANAGGS